MNFRKQIACLLCTAALLSCKKDTRVPGADVQPDQDRLTTETAIFPVYAFAQTRDSIPSFNSRNKFLGCNNDPVFGTTQVGLYLNANMNVTNFKFGPGGGYLYGAELILVLAGSGHCGNMSSALTFSVFEVDSTLYPKRVYYTSNKRLHNPAKLVSVHTTSTSEVFITTDGKVNAIRIPVSTDYARRIMLDEAALQSNTAFQAAHKGLYILASTTSPNDQGAVFNLDLEHLASGLRFVYRVYPPPSPTPTNINEPVDSTDDYFTFRFLGDAAVRYNTVTYTRSGDPALLRQLNGDTAQASPLFVKGLGLIRTKLYIPGIQALSDSFEVSVNRAEIIFTHDPYYFGVGYFPPTEMALLPIGASGKDTVARDQLNATDAVRYNGILDGNHYTFNLARHFQAIMNGTAVNRGFYLEVTSPSILRTPLRDAYQERAVFYGASSALKPQLKLSYMRFRKG